MNLDENISMENNQTQEPNVLPPSHNSPMVENQYAPAKPHVAPIITPRVVDKIEQLIIFVYFAVASILMFRFVLSLFGARRSSPFVNFIYQLTSPFMLPFENMFGGSPQVAQFRLEFEVLVALFVYALVLFGISRLVRIIFR